MQEWKKEGIIFCPDQTNETMYSHAAIPFADKLTENTLRIYFSSRNKKGQSLPFYIDTSIHNPSKISKISKIPLLSLGALGTFDDSGIMPSCIVNYEGKKYLYYIAWNPQVTVSYRLSIGLAISVDNGETFQKYSNGPICDRGLDEPYFNTAPYVIVENGLWRMWYISCTEWILINNYPEPKYHVKYAESADGINWLKKGIICIDYNNSSEAIGRPSVIFEDNLYKMYYSFRNINNYRSDPTKSYCIGYAESKDGICWVRKDHMAGIQRSING